MAAHSMSFFGYPLYVDEWKQFGTNLGMVLLVGDWSWLRASREVRGGLDADSFWAGRDYVKFPSIPHASPGSDSLIC